MTLHHREMYKKVHYVGQKLNALVAVLDVSWKYNLWEDYYWLAGSVVDGDDIHLNLHLILRNIRIEDLPIEETEGTYESILSHPSPLLHE